MGTVHSALQSALTSIISSGLQHWPREDPGWEAWSIYCGSLEENEDKMINTKRQGLFPEPWRGPTRKGKSKSTPPLSFPKTHVSFSSKGGWGGSHVIYPQSKSYSVLEAEWKPYLPSLCGPSSSSSSSVTKETEKGTNKYNTAKSDSHQGTSGSCLDWVLPG